MSISPDTDIEVKDIKQLIKYINKMYGIDYSEYMMASFKRRIEMALKTYHCNLEQLAKKIASEKFLDEFVGLIAVSTTEMFRDTTFWLLLKNTYLPALFEIYDHVRIWIPMCASGEEYYSLAILLTESGWINRSQVYVSSTSEMNLDRIKKGWMEGSKMDISIENYNKIQGIRKLNNYCQPLNTDVAFDSSLLTNTQFFKQNITFNSHTPPFHLVLLRNQMIYFNETLQHRVLETVYEKMISKGILALGTMEEITKNTSYKYLVLSKEESLYQKR